MNQCCSIWTIEIRFCSAATVVNMNEPVQGSVLVTTTMVSPKRKIYFSISLALAMLIVKVARTSAPMVLMRPGAFSWNHGVVFVLSNAAQAKDRNMPAMTELR